MEGADADMPAFLERSPKVAPKALSPSATPRLGWTNLGLELAG